MAERRRRTTNDNECSPSSSDNENEDRITKDSSKKNDFGDLEICLRSAISSNVRMQREIMKRIKCIATLKAKNRMAASRATLACISSIHQEKQQLQQQRNDCMEDDEKSVGTSMGDAIRRSRQQQRRSTEEAKKRVDRGQISTMKNLTAREEKQSKKRAWTRRFFVGPDGSVPQDNDDTILRKRIRMGIPPKLMSTPSSFTRGVGGKWSTEEAKRLKNLVRNVSKSSATAAHSQKNDEDLLLVIDESTIDFHHIAQQLLEEQQQQQQRSKGKSSPRTKTTAALGTTTTTTTTTTRTPEECRIKYLMDLSPQINRGPFTREESLCIMKFVQDYHGHPPWDEVASALTHLKRSSTEAKNTTNNNNNNNDERLSRRTPWQCFHQYRTKLTPTSSRPWTPEDDELLLKYVAAKGPQHISNKQWADSVSHMFFPDRHDRQIMSRIHSSLVNPNLTHATWSEEEERKLALCMRIYADAEPNPLAKAYSHFPDRAPKNVSDKWQRCMNPMFSYKPFTPEEDEALLASVKENGGPGNWTQLSEQFPTNRNPRSLKYRWVELAPEQDVVKKFCDDAERAVTKVGIVVGTSSSTTTALASKKKNNKTSK